MLNPFQAIFHTNMLKPQVHYHHSNSTQSLLTRQHHKAFVGGDGGTYGDDSGSTAAFLPLKNLSSPIKYKNNFHATCSSLQIKAITTDKSSSATRKTKVKAVISVQVTMGGLISSIGLTKGLDDIQDLLGKSILMELVAAEVDHSKS